MSATTATRMTPATGTRLRAEPATTACGPGTAPSRLKAKSIRVQLVMQAMVQKNWPTVAMRRTVPPHREVRAWEKISATPPPPLVTLALVLDGEEERQQEDPAADGRVEDRPPDALGRRVGRRVGLLRQVGRGVVPGDRVLGQQGADGQDDEEEPQPVVFPPKKPVLLTVEVKTIDGAGVVIGQEDQDEDDGRGAEHVPPDRDVVEDREQVAREDVDQGGEHQDAEEVEEDRVAGCPRCSCPGRGSRA